MKEISIFIPTHDLAQVTAIEDNQFDHSDSNAVRRRNKVHSLLKYL